MRREEELALSKEDIGGLFIWEWKVIKEIRRHPSFSLDVWGSGY